VVLVPDLVDLRRRQSIVRPLVEDRRELGRGGQVDGQRLARVGLQDNGGPLRDLVGNIQQVLVLLENDDMGRRVRDSGGRWG
jgi:hypothetical protein